MPFKFLYVLIVCLMLFSCKRNSPNMVATDGNIVLVFTIDSNDNIIEPEVREKVLSIGKRIHESADKMMMHVYTEQTGSVQGNEEIAKRMVRAVKLLTKTQGERSYYNLGVDIRGYENPVDSLNPASMANRRIVVTPL